MFKHNLHQFVFQPLGGIVRGSDLAGQLQSRNAIHNFLDTTQLQAGELQLNRKPSSLERIIFFRDIPLLVPPERDST